MKQALSFVEHFPLSFSCLRVVRDVDVLCQHDVSSMILQSNIYPCCSVISRDAGFDIFGRIPQFRQHNLSASIEWFLKTCAFHALFLGITFFPSNHMDATENHSHACRMQQFLHFYTLIIFQLITICFFFNI